MIPGPKPLPSSLKALRGEDHKSRINTREPQAPEADDTPPDHLDQAAQEHWREMVPTLRAMRCFTAADRPALAIYCCLYARWMWAKSEIQLQGEILRMRNSLWQVNPYLKIESDCQDKMLKILEQFGCTPASRSRLVVPDKPQDSLSQFTAGKPKPPRLKTGT